MTINSQGVSASDCADQNIWKKDWPAARRALTSWWEGKGLAPCIIAPRDIPIPGFDSPGMPANVEMQWLDFDYRTKRNLYDLSHTFYGGVAFPMWNAELGPGSLGLFLGCVGELAPDTVWYHPSITDPESSPPLRFDPQNEWYLRHVELLRRGADLADGRFLPAYQDFIENIDTLAQLRGSQETLMDLIERPEWVAEKIAEINAAYFEAYDAMWPLVKDEWGGSSSYAFNLWAPGSVAKLQCDFSCMISPKMFKKIVQPGIQEQCRRIDYTLYHLDGTQAIPQLDNLLSIEGLNAIEWTPQAGLPGGGDPAWYDLYRRIKAGGKAVQAVGVEPHEVEPLLDAVGQEGMFMTIWAKSETVARDVLRRVGWPYC